MVCNSVDWVWGLVWLILLVISNWEKIGFGMNWKDWLLVLFCFMIFVLRILDGIRLGVNWIW